MSPPTPRLCYRTAPHEDSVLSVAFGELLLASGGEDCALLLHDLRCCSSSAAASASAAASWSVPTASTNNSSSSSSSSSKSVAAARSLFTDPVAALAWQGEQALYVGSGTKVHRVDTRKICSNNNSSGSSSAGGASSSAVVVGAFDDEVSSLSVSRDGRSLAVADDSGAVTLLDLARAERIGEAGSSPSPAPSVAALSVADDSRRLLPCRRLPRPHAGSLATAVAFRPCRAAGESLVSGGCDCTLARWDCRSGRLVGRWTAGEITGNRRRKGGEEREAGGEEEEGTIGAAAGGRVFNPPFVHALAVPSASSAKPWSCCVAAALGDGSVAVLDCDAGHQPARNQQDKNNRNKKNKPTSSNSSAAAAAAAALLSPSSLNPFEGVLAVLRPEDGGHSAAATCVAFVGEGGGGGGDGGEEKGPTTTAAATTAVATASPLVASGGDDGRLLFWRWANQAACCDERGEQLPAAWETALVPFRRPDDDSGGGDRGNVRGGGFIAAATRRGRWKMQALDSPSPCSSRVGGAERGLVAAADTSRVVKVWRVE